MSKKDEDLEDVSPFEGIKKNQVLQDIKLFNKLTISPRACCNTLTKIMYLVQQGEIFTNEEYTLIFFSVTKLFQNQDPALRRLVHLVIKSLDTKQNEVLIVTSSLCGDINNSKIDSFRSNAIRVLAKIIDTQMLNQVERFFKQAIVDKNEFTASSALVAGIHLFPIGNETIKRWSNEVQESVNNKSRMVQYHALQLLYLIKKHDRLAISKIVNSLVRAPPKSPLTVCLLIRYLGGLMNEQFDTNGGIHEKPFLDFLNACLRNKSSMVVYEAAREFAKLKGVSGMMLVPVVVALQDFLNHPLSSQRFAAVRVLSMIVEKYPHLVTSMAIDLERLISDNNRSTATLAITTLLKTGVEASIERLLKSITGFMEEIADEFKIVVVDAIRVLGLKFPLKHGPLLKFLAFLLREDGGFAYKKILVTTILTLMNINEEARETGLDHLCEFVEDCEFSEISVQVLHVLAEAAGQIKNPSKFIRHIYNRVILECDAVRSGAVSALAKIGCNVDEVNESIIVLLNRCLHDMDDETRDRATLFLSFLKQEDGLSKAQLVKSMTLPTSVSNMEYSVQAYLDAGDFSVPFSFDHIVDVKSDAAPASAAIDYNNSINTSVGLSSVISDSVSAPTADKSSAYADLLNNVSQLAALNMGKIFNSSKPVDLTENEAEYQVKFIKHVYEAHVVLQFNIVNTLPDQTIDKVYVELDDAEWEQKCIVYSSALPTNASGVSYLCFKRPQDSYSMGPVTATLKYNMRDSDDVDSVGYPDEYSLEDVEVLASDLITSSSTNSLAEFRQEWETLGDRNESMKKYTLAIKSLQEAVSAVLEFVGLTAIENSQNVAEGVSSHAVNLCGTFIGGVPVLARAGFMLDSKGGVALKIAARCDIPGVAELITNSIQ